MLLIPMYLFQQLEIIQEHFFICSVLLVKINSKLISKEDGISINQFITTALAEKMSALRTMEYLETRASRGNREKFERALSKIGDNNPLDDNDVAIK